MLQQLSCYNPLRADIGCRSQALPTWGHPPTWESESLCASARRKVTPLDTPLLSPTLSDSSSLCLLFSLTHTLCPSCSSELSQGHVARTGSPACSKLAMSWLWLANACFCMNISGRWREHCLFRSEDQNWETCESVRLSLTAADHLLTAFSFRIQGTKYGARQRTVHCSPGCNLVQGHDISRHLTNPNHPDLHITDINRYHRYHRSCLSPSKLPDTEQLETSRRQADRETVWDGAWGHVQHIEFPFQENIISHSDCIFWKAQMSIGFRP